MCNRKIPFLFHKFLLSTLFNAVFMQKEERQRRLKDNRKKSVKKIKSAMNECTVHLFLSGTTNFQNYNTTKNNWILLLYQINSIVTRVTATVKSSFLCTNSIKLHVTERTVMISCFIYSHTRIADLSTRFESIKNTLRYNWYKSCQRSIIRSKHYLNHSCFDSIDFYISAQRKFYFNVSWKLKRCQRRFWHFLN